MKVTRWYRFFSVICAMAGHAGGCWVMNRLPGRWLVPHQGGRD